MHKLMCIFSFAFALWLTHPTIDSTGVKSSNGKSAPWSTQVLSKHFCLETEGDALTSFAGIRKSRLQALEKRKGRIEDRAYSNYVVVIVVIVCVLLLLM